MYSVFLYTYVFLSVLIMYVCIYKSGVKGMGRAGPGGGRWGRLFTYTVFFLSFLITYVCIYKSGVKGMGKAGPGGGRWGRRVRWGALVCGGRAL